MPQMRRRSATKAARRTTRPSSGDLRTLRRVSMKIERIWLAVETLQRAVGRLERTDRRLREKLPALYREERGLRSRLKGAGGLSASHRAGR